MVVPVSAVQVAEPCSRSATHPRVRPIFGQAVRRIERNYAEQTSWFLILKTCNGREQALANEAAVFGNVMLRISRLSAGVAGSHLSPLALRARPITCSATARARCAPSRSTASTWSRFAASSARRARAAAK